MATSRGVIFRVADACVPFFEAAFFATFRFTLDVAAALETGLTDDDLDDAPFEDERLELGCEALEDEDGAWLAPPDEFECVDAGGGLDCASGAGSGAGVPATASGTQTNVQETISNWPSFRAHHRRVMLTRPLPQSV